MRVFIVILLTILLLGSSIAHSQECEVAKILPGDTGIQEYGFGHAVATDGVGLLVGVPGQSPCGPRRVRIHRWEGTSWALEQVLEAPLEAGNRRFGAALAIEGDVALVGAEPTGSESGQAYVYRRSALGEWSLEQTLAPPDPIPQQFFGMAVALHGEWIAIGAVGDDDLGSWSGSVYTWQYSPASGSWLSGQKLHASDGQSWSEFGFGLDLDGGLMVVGARKDGNLGAAYVFRRDPVLGLWSEEQKLIAPAGAANDQFGFAVAASGDWVLVSAPGQDGLGNGAGAAFIHHYDALLGTWGSAQMLTAVEDAEGDAFGHALDLCGDTAVIGAFGDDGPDHSGSALLFRRDVSGAWVQVEEWAPFGPSPDTSFGASISLAGDVAAVGAAFLHAPSGAVYVFRSGLTGQFAVEAELLPPDGVSGDGFGCAVAIDGGRAVVGACYDSALGTGTGSAAVFHRDPLLGGWVFEQQLVATVPVALQRFGAAVAMSGDAILVGNDLDPDLGVPGSASVFRRDPALGAWSEEQVLAPSAAIPADAFGTVVAIEGDLAVVGAWLDDELGEGAGAVYLFRRDPLLGTWEEEQKLLASDGAAGDGFGVEVALGGDVIAVGSAIDDIAQHIGVVYVFRRDPATGAWAEEQILLATDGSVFDGFGRAVDVEGDRIVVGAPLDDAQSYDFGSVYLFRFDPLAGAWTEEQKLSPSDAASYDYFGWEVALSGDLIAIGSPGAVQGPASGAVYIFRRHDAVGEWLEEGQLPASGGLGWIGDGAIALQGETLLTGTLVDDDACLPVVCESCNSGAVHVFDLAHCPLGPEFIRGDANGDGAIDIADPVYGLAHLFANGPAVCLDAHDSNDDGALDVADPVHSVSYLFALGSTPPPPFSTCARDPTADEVHCAVYVCP